MSPKQSEPKSKEWLDIKDLVQGYPFTSRKAVYQLVQRGRLPAYRMGRRLIFKRSEIEDFLGQNPVSTIA
jgi:excisionase family DNA binding protein